MVNEPIADKLDGYVDAYRPEFAYAFDNDLILNWYPHRVVEKAGTGSLLELGVGHGYSTRIFGSHFDRHVIIDGSPKIIEKFRLENPDLKADIVEGFFEEFDTDELFDVICMGFVLEHADDPEVLIRRFTRFLKPGGSLFVTVPNAESMHRRIAFAAGIMQDMFALGAGDLQLGHQQLFSVASLTALFERCGLDVVVSEGLFFKPFTTGQIQQLELSEPILRGMMEVGVGYPELCCALMTQGRLRS
jgi:SAM-dependent methyltransferase